MSCSNCYNGCAETVSDKCVRYTGVNVPALGISSGDTLLYVEQQLILFLTSVLNGQGIKLTITPSIICEVVQKHLPECTDFNLDDVIETIIKAVCDLQTQITALDTAITTLNAPYTVDCLQGVSGASKTHDVLQATIQKLCEIDKSLESFITDVTTNYVKISAINGYIASYIASTSPANKAYSKMVPYTAVEYYGSLSNYPATGDNLSVTSSGTGYWEKVYICNGLNGTPDKRGRVAVGAIVNSGGGTLPSDVNPSNPFNPNYAVGSVAGSNFVVLSPAQIPAHTHPTSVGDPGHIHSTAQFYSRPLNYGNENSTPALQSAIGANSTLVTPTTVNTATSAVTGVSVTVGNNTGGGGAHANNQPAIGCYYIMYIP